MWGVSSPAAALAALPPPLTLLPLDPLLVQDLEVLTMDLRVVELVVLVVFLPVSSRHLLSQVLGLLVVASPVSSSKSLVKSHQKCIQCKTTSDNLPMYKHQDHEMSPPCTCLHPLYFYKFRILDLVHMCCNYSDVC